MRQYTAEDLEGHRWESSQQTRLSTGMAYVWNTQIVAGWGATIGSSVTYLTPIVGVFAGVPNLGDSLTWHQPAGALIIVAGVVLSRSKPRNRSRREREQMPSQRTRD